MEHKIYKTIYARLTKIIPGIEDREVGFHTKLKASGLMDLCVEVVEREKDRVKVSLAHYGLQNGDLMADPEMLVAVVPKLKMAEALHIQQDYLSSFREVYPEPGKVYPKEKKGQNDFLAQWLQNIIMQGHQPEEAEAA